MSQSLSQVYIHLVFHVSTHSPQIRQEDELRLHRYLMSVAEAKASPALAVGGMSDHIHLLLALDKAVSAADLARDLKAASSKWIKSLSPLYSAFSWQKGYGVFSVSPSGIKAAMNYITHQKEHHLKRNTREEYIWLLELYHVKYDPRYLWEE